MTVKYTPEKFAEVFWSRVDKRGPDDCWLWQARCGRDGYGIVSVEGKNRTAHRVALTLSGTPRPPGLFALHSCDVRACCNPAHLRWGTLKENAADRSERGRCADVSGDKNPARRFPHLLSRGEKHAAAKLTTNAVEFIRASALPTRELATRFDVSRATVCRARKGTLWRHV